MTSLRVGTLKNRQIPLYQPVWDEDDIMIPGEPVAYVDEQEQIARSIPWRPPSWNQEAKDLHNKLRKLLVNKEATEPLVTELLLEACEMHCKQDLLLICSFMQTPNLVKALAYVIPAENWKALFAEFEKRVFENKKENRCVHFNAINLRNRHVVECLADIGVTDVFPSDVPNDWKPRIVWGQTYYFLTEF